MYELENITEKNSKDFRHFLKPTNEEINQLKVGDLVRLNFVLNPEPSKKYKAEKVWVEIKNVNENSFEGIPIGKYDCIENIEDVVTFISDNISLIATIVNINTPSLFDESLCVTISKKAFEHREVNLAVRDVPCNRKDSGWKLFYGDENDVNDVLYSVTASSKSILEFEPLLIDVLISNGAMFEFNNEYRKYIEIQ